MCKRVKMEMSRYCLDSQIANKGPGFKGRTLDTLISLPYFFISWENKI